MWRLFKLGPVCRPITGRAALASRSQCQHFRMIIHRVTDVASSSGDSWWVGFTSLCWIVRSFKWSSLFGVRNVFRSPFEACLCLPAWLSWLAAPPPPPLPSPSPQAGLSAYCLFRQPGSIVCSVSRTSRSNRGSRTFGRWLPKGG